MRFDKARLKSVCGQAQFAAGACPPASAVGSAKATTPLLAAPLQGPVYLLAAGAKQPPALVVDLGGAVHVVLEGRLLVSKAGVVEVGFDELPDAPISNFVLSITGGKRGLLEDAANLCAGRPRAAAVFDGQSAVTREERPVLADGCKKARKGKGKKRSGQGNSK
jgi:hypothetical protein